MIYTGTNHHQQSCIYQQAVQHMEIWNLWSLYGGVENESGLMQWLKTMSTLIQTRDHMNSWNDNTMIEANLVKDFDHTYHGTHLYWAEGEVGRQGETATAMQLCTLWLSILLLSLSIPLASSSLQELTVYILLNTPPTCQTQQGSSQTNSKLQSLQCPPLPAISMTILTRVGNRPK